MAQQHDVQLYLQCTSLHSSGVYIACKQMSLQKSQSQTSSILRYRKQPSIENITLSAASNSSFGMACHMANILPFLPHLGSF